MQSSGGVYPKAGGVHSGYLKNTARIPLGLFLLYS